MRYLAYFLMTSFVINTQTCAQTAFFETTFVQNWYTQVLALCLRNHSDIQHAFYFRDKSSMVNVTDQVLRRLVYAVWIIDQCTHASIDGNDLIYLDCIVQNASTLLASLGQVVDDDTSFKRQQYAEQIAGIIHQKIMMFIKNSS